MTCLIRICPNTLIFLDHPPLVIRNKSLFPLRKKGMIRFHLQTTIMRTWIVGGGGHFVDLEYLVEESSNKIVIRISRVDHVTTVFFLQHIV